MCLLSAILEAKLGLSPLCHLTAPPPPIPKSAPATSHCPCSPLTFPTPLNLINESAFTPSTCPCPLCSALPCPYLATCTMLCFFFHACFTHMFHHLLVYQTLDSSLHLYALKNSSSHKPLYSHLVVNKSVSCTKLWLTSSRGVSAQEKLPFGVMISDWFNQLSLFKTQKLNVETVSRFMWPHNCWEK